MIETITKSWGWLGIEATKLIATNNFGNIVFETKDKSIWRICPEEIYCKKVADNVAAFDALKEEPDFIEDWSMSEIVAAAKEELGELKDDERYCLKLPSILGGLYEKSNFGKIPHQKLISYSGAIGFEIKDLPDGQTIRINDDE